MSKATIRTKQSGEVTPTVARELDRQAEAAAQLLKAMSNPQRLRVLCLLLEGELSVGEINERIVLSQSALSQHLAVLRDRQLVSTRRDAQTVYYSVPPGPAHDIIQTLHGIYCDAEPGTAAKGKRKRSPAGQ